ncbi:hypothetical protein PM082_012391 [Marasmius tenuissimus]|nr:hypothetical protein PM082_012391 [Marasmius tenuissimus]
MNDLQRKVYLFLDEGRPREESLQDRNMMLQKQLENVTQELWESDNKFEALDDLGEKIRHKTVSSLEKIL